jgi:glucosamine kinase
LEPHPAQRQKNREGEYFLAGAPESSGFLGIDVGGSATRWNLLRDNTSLAGSTTGFSGHLSNPDVLHRAQTALAAIFSQTGMTGSIVAGVSGLSRNTAEAHQLEDIFRETFKVSHVSVMSDIELASRAAFKPGHGILVYAGTGSIAAHLAADGTLHTAGGKGVLIDDAGGGYWIAVSAMRAILRAEDTCSGSGWSTALGQAMAKQLGGSDWPHVRSAFYGLDRGGIALLAMAVGEAADAGDTMTLTILEAAGIELAVLARMMTNRVGKNPIILAGRASTLHPVLLLSMQNALPGHDVGRKRLDAAKTAMNLAQHLHDLAKSSRQ